MGLQHYVVQGQELLWDLRLLGEDVETGTAEPAVLEGGDQLRLVDDGAAGHVDEHALRADGLDHGPVDDPVGHCATGADGDQHIAITRHGHQVGIVLVGHVLLGAAVVGDLHAEDLGLAGDVLADAPEAEDAELAAADRVGQGHGLFQPLAGPHVAVAGADLARGGEQQGDRHVGHVVVQHLGGVGHDDTALGGVRQVDGVDADAVAGDDLQIRQGIHHGGAGAQVAAGGDGAHLPADLLQKGLAVGALPQAVNGEVAVQRLHDVRHHRADHNEFRLHAFLQLLERPGTGHSPHPLGRRSARGRV